MVHPVSRVLGRLLATRFFKAVGIALALIYGVK